MAQAPKLQARPEHQAKVQERALQRGRRSSLKGKTFEALSVPEKDKLLKQLAVQFGLIEDSAD